MLLVTSRLHQILRPFMLRRLKETVASELPSKVSPHQFLWQGTPYAQPDEIIAVILLSAKHSLHKTKM